MRGRHSLRGGGKSVCGRTDSSPRGPSQAQETTPGHSGLYTDLAAGTQHRRVQSLAQADSGTLLPPPAGCARGRQPDWDLIRKQRRPETAGRARLQLRARNPDKSSAPVTARRGADGESGKTATGFLVAVMYENQRCARGKRSTVCGARRRTTAVDGPLLARIHWQSRRRSRR